MGKTKQYAGDKLTISFEPERCIHAAECVRNHPTVFDPERRPWVDANAASADEIARVIERCPTGALHYVRTDSGNSSAEPEPEINSLRIIKDGPIYVNARATVVNNKGDNVATDTRMALCRCGQSRNKPFCDGRHAEAGFTDSGEIPSQSYDGEASASGALEIRAVRNGPLLCKGAFQLLDSDGTLRAVKTQGAICRCGQSGNKPFCDGSHKRIGFTVD